MGFWEVLVILLIAFIIVGPQKLPTIARELGKSIRWLQKSYNDFKVTAARELDISEDNKSNSQWNKRKS
jgi:sec-independent protein translocase protein TatB